jgi:hypothetical protein
VFGTDNSSKVTSIVGLMASHTASDKIESKTIILIPFMEGLFNLQLYDAQVITFRASDYCD